MVPVTEFRAAVVVGSGSISFEMIRWLVERLPVMVCPRWVYQRIQPIAIHDVLSYLVAAPGVDGTAGKVVEIGGAEGMIIERRSIRVELPPDTVFRSFSGLGGERGWLYMNWAWELRGMLDQLVGGPGFRRGRRDPDSLRPGDALDFWRVEAVEPGRSLRLRAEMKVPGMAWLHFEAVPRDSGTILTQTAYFAPRGLAGHLYWYALYPVHAAIFENLVRRVAQRAHTLPASPSPEALT
jgi:hypothetical protein